MVSTKNVKMLISVIILTYNGFPQLPNILDALLIQTTVYPFEQPHPKKVDCFSYKQAIVFRTDLV